MRAFNVRVGSGATAAEAIAAVLDQPSSSVSDQESLETEQGQAVGGAETEPAAADDRDDTEKSKKPAGGRVDVVTDEGIVGGEWRSVVFKCKQLKTDCFFR